jgi:hypothetical protein
MHKYTVLKGGCLYSHVLRVFHTVGLAAHTMGLVAHTLGLAERQRMA